MKLFVPLAVILVIAGALILTSPQESEQEENINLETQEQEEENSESLELKQEEETEVSAKESFEHCLPDSTKEDSNYYTHRLKPLLEEQGAKCERDQAVDRNGKAYYFHRPAQCFSGAQLDPWQVEKEKTELEEKAKTHKVIIITCGPFSTVPSTGN